MEAVVVDETTTTTAGELWFGGRESYQVWEDEWAPCRSWHYRIEVFPVCPSCVFSCSKCRDSLKVYLHLLIAGSLKGRCVPIHAKASLSFDYERASGLSNPFNTTEIHLWERPVTSLRQAKAWAKRLATPEAIERLLRLFYAEKRGKLIEREDRELGWQEWLTVFDTYPDYTKLGAAAGYVPMRVLDSNSGMMLILPSSHGYSTRPWPSRWDVVNRNASL